MSLDLTSARSDRALAVLCSASPGVFSEQIWARRAWLSRAEDLHPQQVFSAAAADELLSRRGLRTPFLRMAKDGTVIAASQFTGSGGVGAMIADQIRDEDVLQLFANGATIVLQGLHRTWEPVGRLAASLGEELGHPVQVNAYITPAQNQGFAPHYDTHDVFVLQISGQKRWTIHEPVTPLPTAAWETVREEVTARAAEEPVLDATLQPGDSLYLPRGFIHSARAQGQTSIHLTFGIHAVTEADVVRAAMDEVLKGAWNQSLPAGWQPLRDEPDLARIVARLRDHLNFVDLEAVAKTLQTRRAAGQRPAPLRPLAQAQAAAALGKGDVVRLRAFLDVQIEQDRLRLPTGRTVAFNSADRPAMQRLLSGHAVRVQDAGCSLETIAGLLREGVLVIESAR